MMVLAWCNFDDGLEKMINVFYDCKYSLVDNTLIFGKRDIFEKILKNVDKKDVTHNGENIMSVLLGWWIL